jgi:hypothetical protein
MTEKKLDLNKGTEESSGRYKQKVQGVSKRFNHSSDVDNLQSYRFVG